MIKVAVTGNIGSGKTSICRVFEVLGIPVFYADKEARKLYSDPDILNAIAQELGPEVFTSDHQLDTRALASVIFNNMNALQFINQLIHPRVFEMFDHWCLNQIHAPYCLQEAALIFESGSYEKFSRIIVVHAPEELLIQRVVKRDNIAPGQARDRLNNQMGQSEKISRADYALLNDNTQLLIPQILSIDHELRKLSR